MNRDNHIYTFRLVLIFLFCIGGHIYPQHRIIVRPFDKKTHTYQATSSNEFFSEIFFHLLTKDFAEQVNDQDSSICYLDLQRNLESRWGYGNTGDKDIQEEACATHKRGFSEDPYGIKDKLEELLERNHIKCELRYNPPAYYYERVWCMDTSPAWWIEIHRPVMGWENISHSSIPPYPSYEYIYLPVVMVKTPRAFNPLLYHYFLYKIKVWYDKDLTYYSKVVDRQSWHW
jgi:hypothetical protein